MRKARTWARRTVQAVLVLLPLAFLGYQLVDSWQTVRQYQWQLNGWYGLVSVVLLMGGFALLPFATRQVLVALGHNINYRTAYRSYFVAQLSKYLPGGLWVVPGRIVVFGRSGISGVASGGGILIELYLLLLTGTGLFLPSVFFYDVPAFRWPFVVLFLIAPIFLLLGRLAPGRWLLQRLPADLGEQVKMLFKLRAVRLLQILLFDLIFWLAVGTAFFWLINSVHPLSTDYWLPIVSAFSMAWVIGFLAFLTPGGLGVREGALALLLAPFLPEPAPVIIALLARVWWTVADLLSVLIALLLERAEPAHAHD